MMIVTNFLPSLMMKLVSIRWSQRQQHRMSVVWLNGSQLPIFSHHSSILEMEAKYIADN